MARIQPVLSPTELALVDQVAAITGSKRTDVIKSALAVYHWFVRQALTGSSVVARKSTGEEVTSKPQNWPFWKARAKSWSRKNWACSQSTSRPVRTRRMQRASRSD